MKRQRQGIVERKKPQRISREARDFERQFDGSRTPDPLANVPYNKNLEGNTSDEMGALSDAFDLSTFKGRAKAEQDRFELATDSEFWFAVAFKSREQKELFLKAMGWLEYGDKFLNGLLLAEVEGVALPKVDLPKPKGISQRIAKFARDLKTRR